MIIAITSTGKTLKDPVDSHFGRAQYIILYNTEEANFQCYDNNLNSSANQGAGIQTAQNIIELGTMVVITSNCGPKALKVLVSGGIKTFICSGKTVEKAIQLYTENKLAKLD